MRELRGKIVRMIWEECEPDVPEERAHRILTLLREEIERVANPYMEQTRDGECNIYPDFGIFDEARQAILKALET